LQSTKCGALKNQHYQQKNCCKKTRVFGVSEHSPRRYLISGAVRQTQAGDCPMSPTSVEEEKASPAKPIPREYVISVTEAGKMLHLGHRAVMDLIEEGHLPAAEIPERPNGGNKRYRIDRRVIDRMMTPRNVGGSA
jgi:hypothetical protein